MLIDRVIRGRAWIPILAALLLTVVGMRVWALRLGMRHSQATEAAAQLASTNQELKVRVSQLSSSSRIMRLAKSYGMHMATTSAITFVQSGSANQTNKAISSITQPSSSYNGSSSDSSTAEGSSSSSSTSSSSKSSTTSGSSATSTSTGGSTGTASGGSGLTGDANSGGSSGATGSGGTSGNSSASGSTSAGSAGSGSGSSSGGSGI